MQDQAVALFEAATTKIVYRKKNGRQMVDKTYCSVVRNARIPPKYVISTQGSPYTSCT